MTNEYIRSYEEVFLNCMTVRWPFIRIIFICIFSADIKVQLCFLNGLLTTRVLMWPTCEAMS